MTLEELRARIDGIDAELIRLFSQRMDAAAEIAAYKKEHGLPVLDARRERDKLRQAEELAPEELRDYTASLYALLFELSRGYQNRILGRETELTRQIRTALEDTPRLFPERATVACQGGEGANSQLACERSFIFLPSRRYSPPSIRACAATGCCRWKTPRPAV